MDTYFDPEKHEYTVNDKAVPSVTEICGVLTNRKYQINEAVLGYAAARGTKIHELTELYDMNLLPEGIAAEVIPYITAYAKFCRDYKPEWEYTEHQMFSEDFAGTCDRIGTIDGIRRIVDFKTTSSMDTASQISLCCQLAGYHRLFTENSEEKIYSYNGMGVQLKSTGDYEIYDVMLIEQKYCFDSTELFDQLLKLNKLLKGDMEWKH